MIAESVEMRRAAALRGDRRQRGWQSPVSSAAMALRQAARGHLQGRNGDALGYLRRIDQVHDPADGARVKRSDRLAVVSIERRQGNFVQVFSFCVATGTLHRPLLPVIHRGTDVA